MRQEDVQEVPVPALALTWWSRKPQPKISFEAFGTCSVEAQGSLRRGRNPFVV